ncbi:PaaI family thioesterase [Nocardiopsis baichengensis]|uniref:PaaI family thioesterase n=1 Tax=Nocardiopsis baichengensis TaxID=280240 RepID=UPI00034CFC03|nr:PaaI family thioesterase [Nocardiopsis baichengensis]
MDTPDDARDDALDLDLARKVLQAQPFSALVGARLTAFGDGRAVLEVDVRDELRQQYGVLHGGVLGYAADNAITFAAGTAAGADLITAGYSIDYLRPADGVLLRADARVVRAGRTRVVCRCDLTTVDAEGAERPCAVAQGSVSVGAARTR